MRKKNITLIVLVLALAALLAVYVIQRVTAPPEAPETTDDPTTGLQDDEPYYSLIDRETDDIIMLTIQNEHGEMQFKAIHDLNSWVIPGREEIELASAEISSAADAFCSVGTYDKVGDASSNVAEYGLNPPKITVSGTFGDNSEVKLFLGDLTPDGEYFYAMVENDPEVYLIYKSTGQMFAVSYDAYVDKPVAATDVTADMLQYFNMYREGFDPIIMEYYVPTEENALTSELYGTGNLLMVSPLQRKPVFIDALDKNVIKPITEFMLGELIELEPADLSKYGLDSPKMEVSFGYSSASYGFKVGNDTDLSGQYAYFMPDGTNCVFTIENAMLADLYKVNAYILASNLVSLLEIESVKSVEVISPAGTTKAELNNYLQPNTDPEGDPWEEIAPVVNGEPVQSKAFKTYYQALVGMPYEARIDKTSISGSPVITIVYTLENDAGTITNKLYPYNDNFYAISTDYKADADTISYLVSKTYVNEMIRMADDLLSGKLDK